jgi:hypothetical protein
VARLHEAVRGEQPGLPGAHDRDSSSHHTTSFTQTSIEYYRSRAQTSRDCDALSLNMLIASGGVRCRVRSSRYRHPSDAARNQVMLRTYYKIRIAIAVNN